MIFGMDPCEAALAFTNSSIIQGQYDATDCHFCGVVIPDNEGKGWVNGWRSCMSCASSKFNERRKPKYIFGKKARPQ